MVHRSAKEAIHIRDLQGNSPAHDAAQQEHTDCLKYLIESGLNPHQPNEVSVGLTELKLMTHTEYGMHNKKYS